MRVTGTSLVIAVLMLSLIGLSSSVDSEEGIEYGSVARVEDMLVPRYNHTSSLLSDGRVLVTGGTQDGVASITSCETYDIVDGWIPVDDLMFPRMRHDAHILPGSDDLIVTGGWTGNGHPSLIKHFSGPTNRSLSSTEIFDTSTSSWKKGPDLNTGRFWHGSAVTDNDELIVIGGLNVTHGALSSCEVYRDSEWVEFSPLPIPLARYGLLTLNDGSLLVIGGHDGTMKTGSKRCFRLQDDIWKEVASLKKGRGYFSGVVLDDGRAVVTGGFSFQGQPDHMDGEIYDPEKDEWSLISNMAFPRHNHDTILSGDDVVVIGGSNCATGGCHSGIEVYDVDKDEWRDAYHVVLGRKWAHATPLSNGNILINGGKVCEDSAERTELFIPPDNSDDIDYGEVAKIAYVAAAVFGAIIFLLIAGSRFSLMKHQIPHLATLILGAAVMFLSHPLLLPLYIVMVFLTMVWFWANICTHCSGWGSKGCPSGQGSVSARLFARAEKPNFRKAFKMNIWSVALQWFVPLLVGIAFLLISWDWFLLIALVVFSITGFVILPITSKNKGCKTCPQRKDCPFSGKATEFSDPGRK